jgi:hypothetical protein
MTAGRERQAGGRPSKEGKSRAAGRNPLRLRLSASSEVGRKRAGGEGRREMLLPMSGGTNLGGAEAQEGRGHTLR